MSKAAMENGSVSKNGSAAPPLGSAAPGEAAIRGFGNLLAAFRRSAGRLYAQMSGATVSWGLPRAWPAYLLAAFAAAAIIHVVNRGTAPEQAVSRRDADFLPPAQLAGRLDAVLARLKQYPGDAYALAEAGRLHYQKGKDFYIDAINELTDALDRGALDDRIFYCLGVMYQQEGLYSFAVANYEKFLRNRPDDVETRLLLAKLLYQDGRFDAAAAQYQKLHERDRRDPVVAENLGLTLMKMGRRDEARAAFRDLIGRGAEGFARRAHFYLGQMDEQDKNYQQAREHFLAALPDHPDLGLPLAGVYSAVALNDEELHLPVPAKENWSKALRYDPENRQAKKSLKSINAALKKAAREAARKAAQAAKKKKH